MSLTTEEQLKEIKGKKVEVATDHVLIEGILVKVKDGIIEIVETVTGYEEITRLVIIPIFAINFIRIRL
ncbi:hypothetical protein JOD45_002618 [Scopulibacillus daqui]|uniref:DUF2642 domain-containing protein n=1 Tax=Scopulibacillus daqui TaxID=1469162 RepID=A0ABS2Q376_9BACL|nr:hypothetical protein [Scopulibacillus daqui]MBM7646390.1 hypothetical protein [Scopulibacillus daqui]